MVSFGYKNTSPNSLFEKYKGGSPYRAKNDTVKMVDMICFISKFALKTIQNNKKEKLVAYIVSFLSTLDKSITTNR